VTARRQRKSRTRRPPQARARRPATKSPRVIPRQFTFETTGFSQPFRLWNQARYAILILPLIQVGWLLWFIWERTTRVPYWDEWETISLVMKAKTGQLQFLDFWEFHSEHRILVPKLVDLVLIEVTRWNRQIEMTFDLALAIVTFAMLVYCIRRTLGSTNSTFLMIAPLSVLYFSFSQGEDWFAPFQIAFYLTTWGATICVWAFSFANSCLRTFVIAMLGALIASYSSFSGLVVWLAFFPLIWTLGRLYAAVWAASGVAVVLTYFVGFHTTASNVGPLTMFSYVLAYLGAPLGSGNVIRAQFFGAAGLLILLVDLAMYWSRTREVARNLSWLCLALFVLASAGVTARGRGGSGVAQALASRYQVFSVLWWMVIFIVVWLLIGQLWKVALTKYNNHAVVPMRLVLGVNAAFVLAILAGGVLTSRSGYEIADASQTVLRANEACIKNYATASDSCLGIYYPVPSLLAARSSYLAQEHLNIFTGSEPTQVATRTVAVRRRLLMLNATTPFAIDTIGGQTIGKLQGRPVYVQRWRPIHVTGWAVDARRHLPAGMVFLLVDGRRRFPAAYGGRRPDVAKALRVRAYVSSGYDGTIPAGALPDGQHSVQIGVVTYDLRDYYLPTQAVSITVLG
jgi:hypothetical protein